MQKYIFPFFILWLLIFFLGLPLLSPGALLVLDFVPSSFTEFQPWYSQPLQWHLMDILKYVFASVIASKIYFIWVYLLGIYAGLEIGKTLSFFLKANAKNHLVLCSTSILFFLCNPWTYERIITQPGIAMWVFSLGLMLAFLIQYTFQIWKHLLLKASIAAAFSFLFFPHASIMLLVVAVLYSIFYWKQIDKKYFLIAPTLVILLNINWLIGSIFYGESLGTTTIQSFDRANIEGFLGNSLSGLWVELTHLLLYGFWGERYHILTPERFNESWYIFWFIALWVILFGNIVLFKKNRKLWGFLSLLALLSYILALGIASSLFAPLSDFLYQYVPGYIGMREPQKWLGVTMICYALFFGISIFSFSEKFPKITSWLLIFWVFTLLNTWNPMNLWAYQGQLIGITLPKEYFESRDWMLKNTDIRKEMLVLPWHSYVACDWSRGKVLATMSQDVFFPLPVIVADNLEIGTKYSNSTSPVSKDIESYLQEKDIFLLQKNNIWYIISLKNCGSALKYDFLKQESSLELIQSSPALDIYKINYDSSK